MKMRCQTGLSLMGLLCAGWTTATAWSADANDVPVAIQVPAGNRVTTTASATGFQIYSCKETAGAFTWTLAGPEAQLLDDHGSPAGKHYAGPTWEWKDSSKVIGEPKAKVDAPDAHAIPWLLLAAKTVSGKGALEHVTFIQRIHTKGGKAPADGCDTAHVGAQTKIPYTAQYVFFAAK